MREVVPIPNLNIDNGNAIISKIINAITEIRRYAIAFNSLDKSIGVVLNERSFVVQDKRNIKLKGVSGLGKNNNFFITLYRIVGKDTDHFPYDFVKINSLENIRMAESYI